MTYRKLVDSRDEPGHDEKDWAINLIATVEFCRGPKKFKPPRREDAKKKIHDEAVRQ